MAEFSSLVSIFFDPDSGAPSGLQALVEGDTIASSVLDSGSRDALTRVVDSSAGWEQGLDTDTYNNLVTTSGRAEEMVTFSANIQSSATYLSSVLDTSVGSGIVDVCAYIAAEEGTWNSGGLPSAVGFENWNNTYNNVLGTSGDRDRVITYVVDSSANIFDVSSNFSTFSGNIEASTRGLSSVLDASVGSGLVDVCAYIVAEEAAWGSGGSPSAAGFENWNNTYDNVSNASGDRDNVTTYVTGASGEIDNVRTRVTTVSADVDNVRTYVTDASANILDVSSNFSTFSGNIEASTRGLSSVLDASVGSGLVDVCAYIVAEEVSWNQGGDPSAAGFENWNNTYDNVSNASGDRDRVITYITNGSGNIGNVSSYVNNASGEIDNVRTRVTTTSADVDNVRTYVTDASGEIDNVRTRVTSVSAEVDNVRTYVTDGSANILDVSTNFSTFSGNVETSTATIDGRVDTNETNITNIDASVGNLEISSNALYTWSGTVDTSVVTITSDISTNTTNISTNSTNLTDLETSARNLSGILDASTDYPNAYITTNEADLDEAKTVTSVSSTAFLTGATPTLAAQLNADGNSLNNVPVIYGNANLKLQSKNSSQRGIIDIADDIDLNGKTLSSVETFLLSSTTNDPNGSFKITRVNDNSTQISGAIANHNALYSLNLRAGKGAGVGLAGQANISLSSSRDLQLLHDADTTGTGLLIGQGGNAFETNDFNSCATNWNDVYGTTYANSGTWGTGGGGGTDIEPITLGGVVFCSATGATPYFGTGDAPTTAGQRLRWDGSKPTWNLIGGGVGTNGYILESDGSGGESWVPKSAFNDLAPAPGGSNEVIVWTGSEYQSTNSPALDHGGLAGRLDDDHPQYVLVTTNTNLSAAVDVTEADIAVLGGVSADIATNTGNISTNTGNISTNTANISVLGGVSANIATNTGNISTNTGNISTNTGNIATNTANISVLGGVSGNIATNTGNISTNTGNISTNTGNISTNTGNITALGSASGNWNTIYGDRNNIISVSSTVLNNSGTWGGGGGGASAEGFENWNNTYDSVLNTSANWNTAYTSATNTTDVSSIFSGNIDIIGTTPAHSGTIGTTNAATFGLETTGNCSIIAPSIILSATSAYQFRKNGSTTFTDTDFPQSCRDWDSTYNTVLNNSGTWGGGGGGGVAAGVTIVNTGTDDINTAGALVPLDTSTSYPAYGTYGTDYSYTAGNSYVTINTAGTYEVTFNAGFTSTGQRWNGILKIYKGTGGASPSSWIGYGAAKMGYIRSSSGHNESSLIITCLVTCSANDTIGGFIAREATNATCTVVANETFMTIKRMS
jgi:hypothetical protein